MALSREAILQAQDIAVKEIDVPEWKDTVFIRQLSRAEQDEYLRRQYGQTRLKQDTKSKQQEISAVNIYGHDAYLCVCGICDAEGKRIFKEGDVEELRKKNGAVIGRLAVEIVKFSAMAGDVEAQEEAKN